MIHLSINSFSLFIHGLYANYSNSKETFDFFLDPKATAALFEELHIIEGWETDKNGEPVILGLREHDFFEEETGEIVWTQRPVFCFWCDFVNTFTLLPRQQELLIEHHYSTQLNRRVIRKINGLLIPLHSEQVPA